MITEYDAKALVL